jgi:Ran-binding protein 3
MLGSTESSQQGTSQSPSPLKPPSLGNPFARVPKDSVTVSSVEGVKDEDSSAPISEEVAISGNSSTSETHSTSSEAETVRHEGDRRSAIESSSVEVDGDSNSSSGISSCGSQRSLRGIMAPPKFVPLGTPSLHTEESSSAYGNKTSASTTSATTVTPSSSTSASVTGFVFGQNLHERVAEAVSHETSDMKSGTSEVTGTSNNVSTVCTSATTNGTSDMLFTSVIKQDHNNESGHNNSSNISDHGEKRSKSLSEAAREYEEARAIKRKYEEVTVITGEEDEVNILQMNCKLFAFDKAGGMWVERGRGTLRLNDKDCGPEGGGVQSRVVIRTTGSLRVVLNTKIWAGMSVHRPSAKSVQLTAMDSSGQIKVFLVMSSPKDTEQLHKSLEYRVLLAQQASSAQTTQRDQASHSLPPEPSSKKRLSQNMDDTGPSTDVAPV